MGKRVFRIISSSSIEQLEKEVSGVISGEYTLHGGLFEWEGKVCQAVVLKELTGITVDEVKKCTNAGAVAVSGTITVRE